MKRNNLTKKQQVERLVLHEEGLRRCTGCNKVKQLDDFFNKTKGFLGKASHCKVCKLIYTRKYRQNNREKLNEKAREYYKLNSERCINHSKSYIKKNKDKVKARETEYRKKNKGKIKQKRREYNIKNRELISSTSRKYYLKHRVRVLEKAKDRIKLYKSSPVKIVDTATKINDKNPYYKAYMGTNVLHINCYFCGNIFVPVYSEVSKFLQAKEGLGNIYCSDECKVKCSSFNQKYNVIHPDSIQYIKLDDKYKTRSCQTDHLKQLQVDEYGYNFCEKCGEEVEIVELHHTLPVAEYGQEAINSASHLLLCTECHKELTKECRNG